MNEPVRVRTSFFEGSPSSARSACVRVIGAIKFKKILRSFLSYKHSIVQTQLNGVMSEVSVHVFLPISAVADRFSSSDNIGYYLGRKSK